MRDAVSIENLLEIRAVYFRVSENFSYSGFECYNPKGVCVYFFFLVNDRKEKKPTTDRPRPENGYITSVYFWYQSIETNTRRSNVIQIQTKFWLNLPLIDQSVRIFCIVSLLKPIIKNSSVFHSGFTVFPCNLY